MGKERVKVISCRRDENLKVVNLRNEGRIIENRNIYM